MKIKIGDLVRVKNFDGIENTNFKPGETFIVGDKFKNYTGRKVYAKNYMDVLYKNQIEKVRGE